MRVLITGVAGLLGSRLADWLADNTSHDIIGVDDLSGGYIDNVNRKVQFHQFDLADNSKLEKLEKELLLSSEKTMKKQLTNEI